MSIELPPQIETEATNSGATPPSFETGYGMWANYGVSISEEDIDENRSDMFKNFGEGI